MIVKTVLAAGTSRFSLGGSGHGKQRGAIMLDRPQRQGLAVAWKAGGGMTASNGSGDHDDKARRFRDAALPHLDDVYTLARYLLRNGANADDAVQECYLRALRYFDTFRGTEIKLWLFAILRNVCRGEFARRSRVTLAMDDTTDDAEDAAPLWQEEQASPETETLRQRDAETIRRLVAELPNPFREAIVLREINDLSYSEIADVVGVPIGTVMSRLARARSMLRKAWIAEEGLPT
jgi:RNA polymerase sigma factor (sigma-70 family)